MPTSFLLDFLSGNGKRNSSKTYPPRRGIGRYSKIRHNNSFSFKSLNTRPAGRFGRYSKNRHNNSFSFKSLNTPRRGGLADIPKIRPLYSFKSLNTPRRGVLADIPKIRPLYSFKSLNTRPPAGEPPGIYGLKR
jgi:hypothetical protein